MRTNVEPFESENNAKSKEIRLVIKIEYATPVYITSHSDISITGDVLSGMLKNTSSTSQRLNPLDARAEIGTITFEAVDIGGAVTNKLREKDLLDEGLNGLFVELWLGYKDLAFADYRLEQTQIIDKQVTFDGGTYKFSCRDIQREMRNDIFEQATTRVSSNFLIGETTTLNVLTTDGFEPATHGAEWGLNPSTTIYYAMIKTDKVFEIISATGKTSNTFTGLTRALLGTSEMNHNIPGGGSTPTTGPEVIELIYIEGTAPHLAYQLLTGQNFSDVATLPPTWHLGIAPAYVDKSSFENIGIDLHDPADPQKGFFVRNEGLTKTDGKRFIEKELNLLMSCYMIVGPDGKIYLRKMASALTTAPTVTTLDSSNITKATGYLHDFADIKNALKVDWAYLSTINEQDPDYYRTNILLDVDSIAKHKETKQHIIKFKMLHTNRHTQSTLNTALNGIRDRHAGPPEKLKLDLLPSLNNVEVGDVVRVNLTQLRDFQGPATLDRPFEIQRRTINQVTQKVSVDLFGSSAEASVLSLGSEGGGGGSFELPDNWYLANIVNPGTEAGTVLTINGSGFLTEDGTLTGGTTARTVYYYGGDLTVPAGSILNMTGNVELRVMGHFQVDGTVKTSAFGGSFLGSGRGGDSTTFGGPQAGGIAGDFVQGSNEAIPNIIASNSGGTISGIPADMRGVDGGDGADCREWNAGDVVYETYSIGGPGGLGGGSAVIVCRGMGFGAGGVFDLSGAAGQAPSYPGSFPFPPPGDDGGSGMGGAPGCAVIMIDGTTGTSFPILAGNVTAKYGNSPGPKPGKGDVELGTTTTKAFYVPGSPGGYPGYP